MSNVLKSNNVFICQEKKYVFNTRRNTVYSSAILNQSEEEEKQKIDFDKLKSKAEEEANKIVNEAKERAKKIIQDAEQKADTVLEKARKEGYEEGYTQGYDKGLSEGRKDGEKEYNDLINRANETKEEYEKMRKVLYRSCEQDMVRLAVDIARKIIDARMEDDEKIYLRIADKVLSEINVQKDIQLRCSSYDYPIVISNKQYLISRLDGVEDINIVEDVFLEKGSCIVETEGGAIDGSIDVQIEKIKNAFKSVLLESAKEGANK